MYFKMIYFYIFMYYAFMLYIVVGKNKDAIRTLRVVSGSNWDIKEVKIKKIQFLIYKINQDKLKKKKMKKNQEFLRKISF